MARKSRMQAGSPLLHGDNNIPGLKVHKEILAVMPEIHAACRKMGLDYYPVILEFVTYDVMAEIASYGGFPVRYPHWRFGMTYEEMSIGYEHNQYRISEMVINNDPCVIYCMDSNTLVDNIDVICHAIGHNDFFKNNVFFEPTNRDMMNKLANHGSRIRRYIARWGYEVVTEFIDTVLKLETLINPSNPVKRKKPREEMKDQRSYRFPERLHSTHNYMDGWVNTKDYIKRQQEEIEREEAAAYLEIFQGEERDVLGFLKDNAPLKLWQQDILSMLYDEALYFVPQRCTKMINEGWASFVDFNLMCGEGLASLGQKNDGDGIWQYAKHKAAVLGSKYSQNPYKVGFELLRDIEDRWNKGKFGREWEDCKDMREKERWDKKLGLGMEKLFEVRQNYNDHLLVQEFFTPEFCRKKEFFEYKTHPSGAVEIVNDGSTPEKFAQLKRKMIQRYTNAGLPDIRLTDSNHLGKGWLFLQHQFDGHSLLDKEARETIVALYALWKNNVVVATKNQDGVEYLYVCEGTDPEDVRLLSRPVYEKEFM